MVIQRHLLVGGPLTYLDGDLNGDTIVDRKDLALLVDSFGASLAPSSPVAPAAILAERATAIAQNAPRPARLRAIARREVAARTVTARLDSSAVDSAIDAHNGSIGELRASRRRR
jgi:hypothetical protein